MGGGVRKAVLDRQEGLVQQGLLDLGQAGMLIAFRGELGAGFQRALAAGLQLGEAAEVAGTGFGALRAVAIVQELDREGGLVVHRALRPAVS